MDAYDGGHRGEYKRNDMEEAPSIGFGGIDESDDLLRLATHLHPLPASETHIDLSQDDYTPQEVARLLGTSVEVVNRAVYDGDLQATREGRDIVCISRADMVDWMRRRGPGV